MIVETVRHGNCTWNYDDEYCKDVTPGSGGADHTACLPDHGECDAPGKHSGKQGGEMSTGQTIMFFIVVIIFFMTLPRK